MYNYVAIGAIARYITFLVRILYIGMIKLAVIRCSCCIKLMYVCCLFTLIYTGMQLMRPKYMYM